MKRRMFLLGLAGTALPFSAAFADVHMDRRAMMDAQWRAWKEAFLLPDGRIVDHLQGMASHSEGQGYGLVLSAFMGDRATFDLVRGWTQAHLTQRSDALLNWRLGQGDDTPEAMNATDGDILFAWGLSLGADRFDLPEARDWAKKIALAVAERCLIADPRDPARVVILPAAEGFLRGTKAIVNPSYIIPRALHDLALLSRSMRLAQAATDGSNLLAELGANGLVPDWVEIDQVSLRPSSEHAAQYGYEALRVPLYLIWSGQRGHAAVQQAKRAYRATAAQPAPVRMDLTGKEVLETSDFRGYAALRALVLDDPAAVSPVLDARQSYYPATIDMLCSLVQHETQAALF